jgi:hypothetical protein
MMYPSRRYPALAFWPPGAKPPHCSFEFRSAFRLARDVGIIMCSSSFGGNGVLFLQQQNKHLLVLVVEVHDQAIQTPNTSPAWCYRGRHTDRHGDRLRNAGEVMNGGDLGNI